MRAPQETGKTHSDCSARQISYPEPSQTSYCACSVTQGSGYKIAAGENEGEFCFSSQCSFISGCVAVKLFAMSRGSLFRISGFKSPRITALLLVTLQLAQLSTSHPHHSAIPHKIINQIVDHQDVANAIIDYVTKGPAKHQVFGRLAYFVDTYGNRIAGSKNLENAIDFLLQQLKDDGLENVHGENVSVAHWVRGKESAQMISPRNYTMSMLGLGGSVATPPEGITAEVLVVKSFDDLESKGSLVSFILPGQPEIPVLVGYKIFRISLINQEEYL